ncbi:hypothetical protein TNCV_2733771 [Trichonephila clavipes]|nr:hypothetical protein TNCV_2733771 [Trichonephila clavipes]
MLSMLFTKILEDRLSDTRVIADEPSNFEQQSSDEDDISVVSEKLKLILNRRLRKRNFVEGMCCFAPPLVMGVRWSPKLQLQFLHLPCLLETEFCGRNVLFCPTSSDGSSVVPKVTTAVFTFALFTGNGILWKKWKRNFVEGMCCFAPPLVMGGRRSPKLQLQFLHLPCLLETEFCGRNVLFCPTSSDERKRNFVEGMCCFAPPLVMGGRWSPKLQLQFLHLPCLLETEFCGRNVLFCPTSSDERLPVPKVKTAVFTFALFTGNGILWKECVVLPHL